MVKIISHRGNLTGPNKANENRPDVIDYVLNETVFDIEIDVQSYSNSILTLGHDEPQYHLDLMSIRLKTNRDRLWLHCKNLDVFHKLTYDGGVWDLNYFFHTNEDVVITSKGQHWFFPKQLVPTGHKSVIVLPEAFHRKKIGFDSEFLKWKSHYHGICTDYPEELK